MENGSMTRASIFYNGEEIELRLALVDIPSMFAPDLKSKRELRFVSGEASVNPKVVVRSFYSGGQTGAGIDRHSFTRSMEQEDLKSYDGEECTVLTTDINKIMEWDKAEDARIKQDKEDREAKQNERVDKINALPKEFDVQGFSELVIQRGTASFNSSYSSQIRTHCSIELTNETKSRQSFYLPNYFTKSGNLRVKAFASDMEMFFGDRAVSMNPKQSLLAIKRAWDSVQSVIRSIENR
jgi:hypothetical protein